MIIDAFTLLGTPVEFDILEFRLKLLWDYVDKFIIVEADHTFSGHGKPWNFQLHKDRFNWAMDKIVYHKHSVESAWDGTNPPTEFDLSHPCWAIEQNQRDAIIAAVDNIEGDFAGFPDDALIMIGDLDEIPTRETIDYLRTGFSAPAIVCNMLFFYYNLTNLRKEMWQGTLVTRLGYARQIGAQTLRNSRGSFPCVSPAGVHMSYFGDAAGIKKKIESFSHQELNIPEFKDSEHIAKCIKSGADLFLRGGEQQKVDASFLPPYFSELAKEYPQWRLM